jgi:parvulin-like peptidyl-prolyl isomerase
MDKRIRTMFEKTLDECRERIKDATPEQMQNLLAQEPGVVRLALLMKERKLESLGELDQALRQYGSSLDAQARDFGESKLGMQAIFSQITKSPEVTHQEMLDYYEAHAAEYAIEPKAQFEILSVKFANYRTRAEAENAIAAMGNAVYLGGVPFDAVARKHSQEPRASDGGLYDGITKGSLASKSIDQAVFSLEVGKLSQVIEDEAGLHILRVKQRHEASQVSFVDAQEKIRKAIQAQKQNAERQKLLAELSARTSVWTIYDPPTDVATQPTGTMPR